MRTRGLTLTLDPTGVTMWGVLGNQWVTFDNVQTIADKVSDIEFVYYTLYVS